MPNKIIALLLMITLYSSSALRAETLEEKKPNNDSVAVQEQPDFATDDAGKAAQDLPFAKTPEGWTDSLRAALNKARAENKYILALFTGSDWCHYCTQLKKEVFSTPEFQAWADKNVVKLYLDFPKYHQLPEQTKAQNVALFQRFGIQGFPTALFFTPQGQALTTIGYLPGGGANWIKQVEMLLPKTLKVEKSLTVAMKDSAANDIPLLLGIYDSKAKSAPVAKDNIDQTFSSPDLLLPSGKEIVLSKIDYSKLTPTQKKMLSSVSTSKAFPKYILLSSKRDAIYSSEQSHLQPAELAQKISSYLIKPEYDGKWLQDYSEGLKLARLYNKPLLLFFTGSDWCGYCEQMQENIFKTEEFAKKSKDYILVELDFPRGFELPENIRMQNDVVMNAFNIEGFPTIVLESSNGMPIGGFGYTASQSVSDFFETIEKSLEQ